MRKTILYIAISLDGYIADIQGGIDWLEPFEQEQSSQTNPSYQSLMARIDTIIMGKRTYQQIVEELLDETLFQEYYGKHTTYVITHHPIPEKDKLKNHDDPIALLDELQKKDGKDIWIMGGSNLVQQLLEKKRIDEFQLTILPVLLGRGIPLFQSSDTVQKLQLKNSEFYGSITFLTYILHQ